MTVDPKHPDEIHEQISLYWNNENFRGFKFHCDLHCSSITDKGYEEAFNFANDHSWFVLVHWRWDDDVKIWETLCVRYPRVKFLVAHVGAGNHSSKIHMELALLCKSNKNLFLDLTASVIVPGFLEKLVEWAGPEQIVYGSDYPLFDMGYEIGRVTYSNLTQEEKNLILHDNAMRILI